MITLDVKSLETGYGEVQILWGVSLQLQHGQLYRLRMHWPGGSGDARS